MDHRKNDAYFRQRILDDLQFIIAHTEGLSEIQFGQDPVLQDSMMFRLIQVSENAQRLTDPFKASFSAIPWRDVYGLRNRIVHDYGAVDLHIVFTALTRDIPDLLRELSGGMP